MKIVAVLGSPRPQGNSSTLARAFLKAAGEQGAEITEYPLEPDGFSGLPGLRGLQDQERNLHPGR